MLVAASVPCLVLQLVDKLDQVLPVAVYLLAQVE